MVCEAFGLCHIDRNSAGYFGRLRNYRISSGNCFTIGVVPGKVDELGKGKDTFWVRWNQIAMGLRPSPYCAVQIMTWLDETVFGDHLDQDNAFRWDVIELNLPVMQSYIPSKPWVYKKRSSDGRIAADVLTYIDDAHPTGPSDE
jgi:hypothetical protein